MNDRVCIDCNVESVYERKRCKSCVLVYNRERIKQYHKKDKIRYGLTKCVICGLELIKGRPNQVSHGRCRKKVVPNYNHVKRSKKGNTLARQMVLDVGFNLTKNFVVHHIDENPNNNNFNNFWVMSLNLHNSLHRFLQTQWSLFAKANGSNSENCWNSLRGQLTTTWLEMTSVKVLKITDIGQSAAEHLNENNIYFFSFDEGSETMYRTPVTCSGVGEDIVRTQNNQ